MVLGPVYISNSEFRKLMLFCQGLTRTDCFGKGKSGVSNAISQLGYIQIDAISVVERAHHHTLWSRVSNYKPEFLNRLVNQDKQVFEYWSHAVAYLPMHQFRYHRCTMEQIKSKSHHWYPVSRKLKDFVYDTIKAEGPLFARDFEGSKKSKRQMWDFKPAKQALHELFMTGEIMVCKRENFQRQYDLTERVLPEGINLNRPSGKEQAQFHLQTALKANGLMTQQEIQYLRNWIKPVIEPYLAELIQEGFIVEVQPGNVSKKKYYALPDMLSKIPKRVAKKINFLSPFDNAIIQRKRISDLFDFNYQTEIYLPEKKRKYGYFSMPVLWGSKLIGRIDPKADRKNKLLLIKNIQIENDVKIDDQLLEELKRALTEFALFNSCPEYKITNSIPKDLRSKLM